MRASYASSPRGPGAATRRERRAPLLLRAAAQAPEGKSLSIAHRNAVDATPSNKDKRRCKPARKLGPPSSARGANSSHKKYNQAWWFVEPWGLFLIRYVASHSTGFGGRSFTSADMPSSSTGTTVVSKYARIGKLWTCMAFWTSSLAFRAAATSAGSGAWTCATGAAVFSRLRGVFHACSWRRRRRRAAGHVARVGRRFLGSGRFRGGASRRSRAAPPGCYQRRRGASGAGADSVMSVGFSSSAIFDQFCVAGSWSCQLSALDATLSRALDRWELDPSNLFSRPTLLLRRDQ